MGQLAKSLSAECKDAQQNGASPVGVHTLSPGLVFTELVAAGNDSFGQTGRFFVNTIGAIPVEVCGGRGRSGWGGRGLGVRPEFHRCHRAEPAAVVLANPKQIGVATQRR